MANQTNEKENEIIVLETPNLDQSANTVDGGGSGGERKLSNKNEKVEHQKSSGLTIPWWIIILGLLIIGGIAQYYGTYYFRIYFTAPVNDDVGGIPEHQIYSPKHDSKIVNGGNHDEVKEGERYDGGSGYVDTIKKSGNDEDNILQKDINVILKFVESLGLKIDAENLITENLITENNVDQNTKQEDDYIPTYNYDPTELTLRRGKLPGVRNATNNELIDMASGAVKFDDIFTVMAGYRNHLPEDERPVCFCHHHLAGYRGDAINLMMIWDGDTVIKAVNGEIVGERQNVYINPKAVSTRSKIPNEREIKTAAKILFRYIDASIEDLDYMKYGPNGNRIDSRVMLTGFVEYQASCIDISSKEMNGLDQFFD